METMKGAAWRARRCVGWACWVSSSPRGQFLLFRGRPPRFSFPLGGGGVSASPLGSGDLSLGRSGKGGRGWGEGKGKDVLRSDEAKKRRSKDCEEWKKGVETTEGLQAFVALSFFFFGARKAAGSQAHKKVELIAPCWKADRQLLACVAWGVLE